MDNSLTDKELEALAPRVRQLVSHIRPVAEPGDIARMKRCLIDAAAQGLLSRDQFGLHHIDSAVDTAITICRYVSPDRTMVASIMLSPLVNDGHMGIDTVRADWGDDIAETVSRLIRVTSLYSRHATVESENFKRLLLAFAEDIRVIIIMIAARLALMRAINHHPDNDRVVKTAYEAGYLYAPLAHRLGLYAMKSELEDLPLKYTDRETFTSIARKLNETKKKRDAYIDSFIAPVKK